MQQKFSHGRTKSVEVVKKKKRMLPGTEPEERTASSCPPDHRSYRTARCARNRRQHPHKLRRRKTASFPRQSVDRLKALAAKQVRDAEEEHARAELQARQAEAGARLRCIRARAEAPVAGPGEPRTRGERKGGRRAQLLSRSRPPQPTTGWCGRPE